MTVFKGLTGVTLGTTTDDDVILVLADGIGNDNLSFSQLSRSAFSKFTPLLQTSELAVVLFSIFI